MRSIYSFREKGGKSSGKPRPRVYSGAVCSSSILFPVVVLSRGLVTRGVIRREDIFGCCSGLSFFW